MCCTKLFECSPTAEKLHIKTSPFSIKQLEKKKASECPTYCPGEAVPCICGLQKIHKGVPLRLIDSSIKLVTYNIPKCLPPSYLCSWVTHLITLKTPPTLPTRSATLSWIQTMWFHFSLVDLQPRQWRWRWLENDKAVPYNTEPAWPQSDLNSSTSPALLPHI